MIQRLERLGADGSEGKEGKVTVYLLPKCGHWVHVDNPKGLLEIVSPKIARGVHRFKTNILIIIH